MTKYPVFRVKMTTFYPKVYISVLNWNGWEKSAKCIDSILQSDYDNYVILVVDNRSSDDSVWQLKNRYPALEIISSPTNLGYAGGNRLALERAIQDTADLFWILNNDCEVNRDTLGSMINAYIDHGDALYGSVTLRCDGARHLMIHNHFGLLDNLKPDFGKRLVHFGVYYDQLLALSDNGCLEVANLVGNSLMIPISVVKTHGFISEDFFLYSEDWEYSFRMRQHNIPSLLILASIVTHEGKASYKENTAVTEMITYYRIRNDLIVLRQFAEPQFYREKLVLYLKKIRTHFSHWLRDQLSEKRLLPLPATLKFEIAGLIDGVRGRMGKVYAPEDYI